MYAETVARLARKKKRGARRCILEYGDVGVRLVVLFWIWKVGFEKKV
jgi:hypothetical protein